MPDLLLLMLCLDERRKTQQRRRPIGMPLPMGADRMDMPLESPCICETASFFICPIIPSGEGDGNGMSYVYIHSHVKAFRCDRVGCQVTEQLHQSLVTRCPGHQRARDQSSMPIGPVLSFPINLLQRSPRPSMDQKTTAQRLVSSRSRWLMTSEEDKELTVAGHT